MTIFKKNYQLVSFAPIPDFTVSAELCVTDQNIILGFDVQGPIKNLSLKERSSSPARRDKLWEDTCFELFLKPNKKSEYFEVNVSPSGDWNVYMFSDYRKGMTPTSDLAVTQSNLKIDRESLKTDLTIVKKIDSHEVQIGISCILKDRTGKESFWAIKHKKEKPDFHLASNYILVPITHI